MKRMDLADNKLSILFFVDTLNIPLTNAQITEFFLIKYFMNYFDLQQLLGELVDSQHMIYMEGRNSNYYFVAEKGKEALIFFRTRIDFHTQELITTYAKENRDRIKKESQLTADYSRLDNNEYEVLLRVMEGEITLIELRLNVISIDQAKTLCNNWKAKAPEVYKSIMESLM